MTATHYTSPYRTRTTALQWFMRFWLVIFSIPVIGTIATGNYLDGLLVLAQLAILFVVLPTIAAWTIYKNPWAVERAVIGAVDLLEWSCNTRPMQFLETLNEYKFLSWIPVIILVPIVCLVALPLMVLLTPPLMVGAAFPRLSNHFAERFWPPADVLSKHGGYIMDSVDERLEDNEQ